MVRRCDALIDQIELPVPFDMDLFCAQLGRQWNSTVIRYPKKTGAGEPCGTWLSLEIAGASFDLFAYDRTAPPWHQAQMIFHEIGHRLAGHVAETALPLS